MKAILFDMDGVLVESHDAWFYIFNKALKKFENKEITRKEFDKVIWSKAFDKVAKKYFTAPIKEIRDYYTTIYDDYLKRLTVMPNANEALSNLKSKRIKLVIVSNTNRSVIELLLKDIGLSKYFSFVLGGDDVKNGKPEPDIIFKALDILKLEKEEVLFVGDTKWDKLAAKKANVKFVGFKLKGDYMINGLKELVELV